jgi:hypothetical protein
MNTALATPQWQAFTRQYWQVEPVRFAYAPRGPNGPALRAICYRDRKGRLVLPPFQPHLPLEFRSTPTKAPYRLQRQWLEMARLFVEDMIAHGIRGEVTFSPVLTDPRPWIWSSFRVSPWFTNYIDFPFSIDQADRVVRQQANKARRAGCVCTRTDQLADAVACLSESEHRKGFSYGVTLRGLQMAHDLLGPEAFRVYVCYGADGKPASARVVLHRPGGRACDWMAGTSSRHLRDGATQLLIAYMLDDLQGAEAIGYNSCGASRETVAIAKTIWGGRLMTQYVIEAYDLRPMKQLLRNMLRFRKRRAAVRRSKAWSIGT